MESRSLGFGHVPLPYYDDIALRKKKSASKEVVERCLSNCASSAILARQNDVECRMGFGMPPREPSGDVSQRTVGEVEGVTELSAQQCRPWFMHPSTSESSPMINHAAASP
jgi:hypothetical protein